MRELDFSDGFASGSAPTGGAVAITSLQSYVNDAAFVTGKGSAAANGDAYYNSTLNVQRNYDNGAWVSVAIQTGTSGGIPYFSSATAQGSSAALTAHGVVLGGGAGAAPTSTAAGTSGQVLTSNGSSADPTFQAAQSSNSAKQMENVGLSCSVGASALTIALKQADGSTNASSGASAAVIGFRSATATSGAYNLRSVTGALSVVVPSTATLGHVSGMDQYVWVYAMDNAGTVELAVCGTLAFKDKSIASSTTISGSATSATVLYSTTGRSNLPIRLIGRLLVNEVTAGTWASAPTDVVIAPTPFPTLTDWTSWTPTGSWLSNTTYTGLRKRVGDTEEYDVTVALSGAPTSASLTVTLPSGISVDTAKVSSTSAASGGNFGIGTALDSGTNSYPLCVLYNNTTSVVVNNFHSVTGANPVNIDNGSSVTQAVPFTFGNADKINIRFSVPVTGWSTYGP